MDRLAGERAELARTLAGIDSIQSALDFQVALANSIRAAESLPERDEAKFHNNILRRMGDAFATQLLGAHTVREFARDRGRPPHLTGQGADFEFVLDTASSIATAGAVPIIADLTTLLSVGDIIAMRSDLLLLIECKNRVPPKPHTPRGRLWRQMRRRDNATTYLRDDQVVEEGGTRRIAIDADMLEPRNDLLIRECILASELSDTGLACRQMTDNDFIVAIWNHDWNQGAAMASLSNAMHEMRGDTWRYPLIGGGSEFMRSSSPWHLNPFSLDIDIKYQIALAEGDLMLWRFADISPIVGPVPDCCNAAIRCDVTPDGALQLKLTIDNDDHSISHRFLDEIGLGFMPVRAIRDAIHQLCGSMVRDVEAVTTQPDTEPVHERSESRTTSAGPSAVRGRPIVSAIAYKSPAGDNRSPVLVVDLEQLMRLGYQVPVDELRSLYEQLDNSRDWAIPLTLAFTADQSRFDLSNRQDLWMKIF
ncbi:hypothetical protein ACQPZQ_14745 [Pseudonocardia sp. CA-142604]|uniref:hypothetical protein n=1 Tax=Pseudonocardia sp. CA-142604 TaxID=3240024 RepID=UPI003D8F9376